MEPREITEIFGDGHYYRCLYYFIIIINIIVVVAVVVVIVVVVVVVVVVVLIDMQDQKPVKDESKSFEFCSKLLRCILCSKQK
jgi:hypothetical protein